MSEKLKEYLELFFDKSIFIPTKTIELTGEVDDDMYRTALIGLHALDSMSGEISIKLRSEGGSVEVARAITDLITGCKNRVRITCYGEVASAATIILQAADERIMRESSKLLIHVGSEGVARDHPRNVDAQYEDLRADETWIEDIYLKKIREKKPRFTRQKMKDLLQWDKFIYPKEALELGLIDSLEEAQ